MMDINNLKYINDTYGHKNGDQYIKGCCRVLSKNCKMSPIYRVGGDEFVVILQGADYANRKKIFEQLKDSYREYYNDASRQPWERYSASIGMSQIQDNDAKISDVFSRADGEMYKAKSEFRLKNGQYR